MLQPMDPSPVPDFVVGGWLSPDQYTEWKALFQSWLTDAFDAEEGASASMVSNEKCHTLFKMFDEWD